MFFRHMPLNPNKYPINSIDSSYHLISIMYPYCESPMKNHFFTHQFHIFFHLFPVPSDPSAPPSPSHGPAPKPCETRPAPCWASAVSCHSRWRSNGPAGTGPGKRSWEILGSSQQMIHDVFLVKF